MSDSQSGELAFDTRSGHLLDLFSFAPSSNPRPTGFLLPVIFGSGLFLFFNLSSGVSVN